MIYKYIGVLGLVLICGALVSRKKKRMYILYISGGTALLFYSLYLQDTIFIILQFVFILFALYEYYKLRTAKA